MVLARWCHCSCFRPYSKKWPSCPSTDSIVVSFSSTTDYPGRTEISTLEALDLPDTTIPRRDVCCLKIRPGTSAVGGMEEGFQNAFSGKYTSFHEHSSLGHVSNSHSNRPSGNRATHNASAEPSLSTALLEGCSPAYIPSEMDINTATSGRTLESTLEAPDLSDPVTPRVLSRHTSRPEVSVVGNTERGFQDAFSGKYISFSEHSLLVHHKSNSSYN